MKFYAWRIRDPIEKRDYLTLSANEAAHYGSIGDCCVTIVVTHEGGASA